MCRGREPSGPTAQALPGVPQSVSDTYGFAKKVNLPLHVLVSHTSPGGRRKRSAGTGVCGVAGGSAFVGVWVRPVHQSCPLTASGFLHVSRVALRHECRQRGSFLRRDLMLSLSPEASAPTRGAVAAGRSRQDRACQGCRSRKRSGHVAAGRPCRNGSSRSWMQGPVPRGECHLVLHQSMSQPPLRETPRGRSLEETLFLASAQGRPFDLQTGPVGGRRSGPGELHFRGVYGHVEAFSGHCVDMPPPVLFADWQKKFCS